MKNLFTKFFRFGFLGVLFAFLSSELFAETKTGSHLSLYGSIMDLLGIDHKYSPICSSFFVLGICLVFGIYFKSSVEKSLKENSIIPQGRFNLRTMAEMILSFIDELTSEQCGKFYKFFFPLLLSIFLFILVSNLSGLVPGFPPFTENFSANLVIGLSVFLCYNIAGIYEHRASYLKQFAGPFIALAPLFLVLETISHLARPLSLSFRLTANIYGDHLLLSIFSGLVPFLVPSFLLFFGLLVAVIQSFVFTMLTGIYVNMAISHDH
jgi:F-type H+-transporting ATPase subunit a